MALFTLITALFLAPLDALHQNPLPQDASTEPGTISGAVVRGEDEVPAANILVELLTRYGTAGSAAHRVYSQPDGSYRMEDVPAGFWRLRITVGTSDAGYSLLSPIIETTGAPSAYDIHLPKTMLRGRYGTTRVIMGRLLTDEDTPPGTFSGVVIDADTQRPVPGAQVTLAEKDDPSNTTHTTTTSEKGVFTSPLTRPVAIVFSVEKEGYETLAVGALSFFKPYALIVNLRTEAPVNEADETSARPEYRITGASGRDLEDVIATHHGMPFGVLTGSVSTDNGAPTGPRIPAGARIELFLPDFKFAHRFLDGVVSEDGTYSIPGIGPGNYDIRITHGPATWDIPGVAITRGTNTMDFTL